MPQECARQPHRIEALRWPSRSGRSLGYFDFSPRNPDNPFYTQSFNPQGYAWVDQGLGGFLAARADYAAYADENRGKQKVPTLRNVDKWDESLGTKVKAFGHNGYFKSLEQIVHFYNTRDAKPVWMR